MPTKTAPKKTKTTTKRATKSARTKAPTRATSKKAVTKNTAKKPSSRSTTKKSVADNLIVAPPAQAFWVCDGTVLHSLVELAAALERMEKNTYAHHVTRDKNDFAAWIELVLEAPEVAAAVRKARTQKTALTAVTKRIPKTN